MGSSPSVATPSPPPRSVRSCATLRRSSATSPSTSSRRWPLLPARALWRSLTSFPMDRSSPSETRGSGVLKLYSSLHSWYGVLWHPRDYLQLHHEVRRGHQEGSV